MSRSEYRTFVGASLDSFLNLITTLLAFAIIIAVLGIANTLALSVLERTREIGVLRALGMTRSQTRSMVRWESVIISLLGAVLGLTVGLGLGVVVAGSLHDLGINEIAVPGGNLILYAVAAGVLRSPRRDHPDLPRLARRHTPRHRNRVSRAGGAT